MTKSQQELPIQPAPEPIICSPYVEPGDHWLYEKDTGEPRRAGFRRPAGYWYKDEQTGAAQMTLTGMAQEQREDLPLINLLRDEVRRWRETDYRGASNVTRALLHHWARKDRERRLFFCQREAAETVIYLNELRIAGKGSKTQFKSFPVDEDSLQKMLRGVRPDLRSEHAVVGAESFFPTLVDRPNDAGLLPLRRMGCKMATGTGKTVIMAMLISWAFCNRGQNPESREFPNGILVVCPNLTVKERLQVLRPEIPGNYFEEFDMVPTQFRQYLQAGKVLVTNWHAFAPESEHKEGDRNYAVVNKGPETVDVYARRVLGDLHDRMPIMVLNDEGHHCWRPPRVEIDEKLSTEEKQALLDEQAEARVWLEGLDKINAGMRENRPGITMTVDLSATPFYIKGSGYPEGRPFPWLVSDFGLVDAIESGITKIPRLPVQDTTGRPDPKYFRLWEWIRNNLQPGEKLPGKSGKPKPDVVYKESEGALLQIAGQWVERWQQIQESSPGADKTPPVLIVVCDNTDIAQVFYQNISGEHEEEVVTQEDVAEVTGTKKKSKKKKKETQTVYGNGRVHPDYFSNSPQRKYTIRIDTKLLAEAESDDPNKKKSDAAEELRRVVATVGKTGQPGEHVRCVVSVSMLTEGWDANNVTNILGIRAFGSQLLCEQVVGRGLRRMDYTPDPDTGMLTPEYVDVYGIPFSVIPFKGRGSKTAAPEDKPKTHVRAVPERSAYTMRFPVVEGYVFALKKNIIRCKIDAMEPLDILPFKEPTATFVRPATGYFEGSIATALGGETIEQNREAYYKQHHIQTIMFEIARQITNYLVVGEYPADEQKRRVLRLQSRHQLFPQVFQYVQQYVKEKVNFGNTHQSELGLERYVQALIERLRDAIEPDATQGEPPLLPILNRYKPIGTTAEVDFKTIRACRATQHSHINQVVLDTQKWESSASFRLEQLAQAGVVKFYARNDHLGMVIPYQFMGVDHSYEPDFLVRLVNDVTLLLEIKGFADQQTAQKHEAARKWVSAVNNWGQLGCWDFHVCREPQVVDREVRHFAKRTVAPTAASDAISGARMGETW